MRRLIFKFQQVLSTRLFLLLFLLGVSNLGHASPMPYVSVELGLGIYDDNIGEAASLDGGMADRFAIGMLWEVSDPLQAGIEVGINAFQEGHGAPLFWNARSNKQRSSVDALGVINYALNRKFDLFARAGAAYSWYEYELTGIERWTQQPYSYSGTSRSWRPKAGLGTAYNINDHFAIKLSLNKEFAGDWAMTGLLGLQYNF